MFLVGIIENPGTSHSTIHISGSNQLQGREQICANGIIRCTNIYKKGSTQLYSSINLFIIEHHILPE